MDLMRSGPFQLSFSGTQALLDIKRIFCPLKGAWVYSLALRDAASSCDDWAIHDIEDETEELQNATSRCGDDETE